MEHVSSHALPHGDGAVRRIVLRAEDSGGSMALTTVFLGRPYARVAGLLGSAYLAQEEFSATAYALDEGGYRVVLDSRDRPMAFTFEGL